MRICGVVFAFCFFLASPIYAENEKPARSFKDLDASFSYDGDVTGTVEICNPTDSEISYFDGFEEDRHFASLEHERLDDNGQPVRSYSFVAEVNGKFEGLPVDPDTGTTVTLKPKTCERHSFNLHDRGGIFRGVAMQNYKFRMYITLYDKAAPKTEHLPAPSKQGGARVKAIKRDPRPVEKYEHVLFQSRVYVYQSKIDDIGSLDVRLTQDGEKTLIEACNPGERTIRFKDHLFLSTPHLEPYGIYAEYKTDGSDKSKKTSTLFWRDVHSIILVDIPEIRLKPGSCLSRTVDVVSVLRGLEDRAAAQGKPMRIESFRVHAAIFEAKPHHLHEYADMDFEGSWVDLKQATGERAALDYNALDVTFKTEGADTAITVCNSADKPVVFRDSLFLDQPEKKPFGILAEVEYEGFLGKYEMIDRLFYSVSLPRVSEARLGPRQCKGRIVDFGRALYVYLRANPPPEGKKVAQYRPVVVLFEDAWDFLPGKLPHRIFGGEWAAYKGKTAP